MFSTFPVRRMFFLLLSILFLSSSVFSSQIEHTSEPLSVSLSQKKVTLTTAEQEFLRTQPRILLGINEDWAPYVIRQPSGKLEGFEVDILNHINAATGANIELVAGPWKETVTRAEKREIDGLTMTVSTKDRAESFLFSNNYLSVYPAFVVGANTPRTIESIDDLNGKTVAILAGHKFYQKLLSAYPDITILEKSSEAEVIRTVVEGKAFAAIVSTTSYDKYFKSFARSIRLAYVATDHPLQLLYSIRKDWPQLIGIINKGLASLSPEEFNKNYYRWFGMEQPVINTTLQPVFSEAEKTWLAQKHLVRVHIGDYAPYYSVTNNKVGGLCVDYLDLVAKRAGFRIKYVTELSWSEALNDIRKHQNIDLLPAAYITEERTQYLNFTTEYLKSPSVIFTRNDGFLVSSMADLAGKTIAAEEDFATTIWLAKEFPDVKQLLKPTTVEALQALSSGEADAFIGDLTVSLYTSRVNGFNNLKVAAPSPFITDYNAMAVRNDWPELTSIINKTLQTFTPAEHVVLRSQWSSPIHYDYGILPMDVFLWITGITGVFSIIIFIGYRCNRRLNQEVCSRKEAEQRSQISEAHLKSILRSAPIGIGLTEERVFRFVNDQFAEMLGYTQTELIGQSSRMIYPSVDEFVRVGHDKYEEIKEKSTGTVETMMQCKDGELLDVLLSSTPLSQNDLAQGVTFTALDITERKHAEKAIRESKERFKDIAESLADTIWEVDPHGVFTYASQGAQNTLGYEPSEILGKRPLDFMSEEEACRIKLIFKEYASHHQPFTDLFNICQHKDGSLVYLSTSAKPIISQDGSLVGYRGVDKNITQQRHAETERRELELQLRQKYKMEAVGVMAGGMAHNFNNNLSIILGNLELSKMKLSPQSEICELVDNAKIAVLRSRDLVKQIMTYSRKEEQQKAPLRLSLMIDETITLLKSTIPSSVYLQMNICPDSTQTYIQANASQIQEILLNLCNNAVHAMDEQGKINISLEAVELEQQHIPANSPCKPGHLLCLSVQDTGCGITADILDKIFDPFFTTKELYEGTGMGLSTVQGVMSQLQGMITVESHVGHGTTFKLYFPIVSQDQEVDIKNKEAVLLKGTEKILLVDDDEMLVDLYNRMLSSQGYQVTAMTNSVDALEHFIANADSFKLVITDQTMPDLTGKELIQNIKQIKPDISTILCTGYSSKVDEAEAKKIGADSFLMKPLDLAELLQTIRRVLDRQKK